MQKGWILSGTDSNEAFVSVAIANGEIGILAGHDLLDFRQVILKSSFRKGSPHEVSATLEGINPLGISLKINNLELEAYEQTDWKQSIDLRHAVHDTWITTPKARIHCALRALRQMPHALMVDIDIEALADVEIEAINTHLIPEGYVQSEEQVRNIWCHDAWRRIVKTHSTYNNGEDHLVAASHFICRENTRSDQGQVLKSVLQQGETARFSIVGVIVSSAQFVDPYTEAERQVVYALHLGHDALVERHNQAWAQLWEGDIELEGDLETQRDIRFALFNLYSSIRAEQRMSIAPMGLSSKGYNGHIFWDAETWMFPPLLVLHPELARQMLHYRYDRLQKARQKALTHGYRGAMFPWESDLWGEESTPTFALCGTLEHHITADVGLAAWNYFCVTHDHSWFEKEGYPLMKACADFWISRVTKNDDGSYSIQDVVGADEYAIGVTDNAFTNGAVKSLMIAMVKAAHQVGQPLDPLWSEIGHKLRLLTFEGGVTREHASYMGEVIKQADVNLLAYPLRLITDPQQQVRDMEYYAPRIDPKHGPAMSHSVFAVQYARMGKVKQAYEAFLRSYQPNRRMPYGVITETPTSMNPYFMTGAGGMLQAVIFGFGGLEITDEGLVFGQKHLPKAWRNLRIKRQGRILNQ